MILALLALLTGGRPMLIDGVAFGDVVNGKPVYYVTDRFGRRFMAHGRWSLFRVRLEGEG